MWQKLGNNNFSFGRCGLVGGSKERTSHTPLTTHHPCLHRSKSKDAVIDAYLTNWRECDV